MDSRCTEARSLESPKERLLHLEGLLATERVEATEYTKCPHGRPVLGGATGKDKAGV